MTVCQTFSVAMIFALGCGGSSASRQPARRPAPTPADLVLLGGQILTVDPDRPRASALAVVGDRIAAVGDDDEIRPLIGPATRVVELGGRGVTPGLVDGHCHLYGLGLALDIISVRDAASEADAVAAVAAAATRRPDDDWLVGRGWDQNLWTPAAYPSRASLDAAIADRPVVLRRIDGHAIWVNSAALARAGITRDTPEPAGGRILRDAAGEPTGILVDNAIDLVEGRIPAPAPALLRRRIEAAAQAAIATGLTGVHEMGIDDATAAAYRELAAAGRLPLRVYAFAQGSPATVEALASRPIEPDDGTAHFAMRGIKLYADGALGSRGAALLAPYRDDPGNQGNWVASPDELARAAMVVADHGWQLGVHAIGDAANRAVLDAYQKVVERLASRASGSSRLSSPRGALPPELDLRFRIEHAQVLAPSDLPRFARLHVLAAMQPTHATSDMGWAEARLGPERMAGAYAWRSLLDSGARIVGGSDFPVEEVSPLLGLYAAVTRQDRDGQPPGGWYPEQRMTLDEAVSAFTIAPAYAAFVETSRGRLRAGYVADITVYDQALVGDESLLRTGIDLTIVGGRVVFERHSEAGPSAGEIENNE